MISKYECYDRFFKICVFYLNDQIPDIIKKQLREPVGLLVGFENEIPVVNDGKHDGVVVRFVVEF